MQQASHIPASKPNIVFIVADDLRYDALGYLDGRVRTPWIDRMSSRGIRFQNSFVTTSIGAIGRASIFTGMYARRHNIANFTTPMGAELINASYPTLLRQAGYRTGFFGNYGVGNLRSEEKGATDAQVRDGDRAGFDVFENTGFSYYPHGDRHSRNHIHAVLGDRAEAFIGADSVKPFCLSISFASPHDDIFIDDPSYNLMRDVRDLAQVLPAEPDLLALYANDEYPLRPTESPEAIQSLPAFIQRSMAGILGARNYQDASKRLEYLRRYYALVSGLDRVIGRIVSALERSGVLRNTAIVLTSDNGYFLGDYGLHEKSFGYESSIRVPLLIVPPGQVLSRDIEAPVLNVDLAPTLLSLAGVAVPPQMQGCDLSPFWRGEMAAPWRTDFLYEHHLLNAQGEPASEELFPTSEGVRDERYTYLRYPHQGGGCEVLFDRVVDPHQMSNAIDEVPRSVVEQLRGRTDELISLLM